MTPSRLPMRSATLVWACVGAIPAAAQVAGESGAQDAIAQRMARQFDFREPENLEDVPMFWRRVKGEGFPHFAEGRFDHEVGHDAPPSFLLKSNGGGVGFFYYARGIPAQPGSDYEIAMWVRPRSLGGARFFASAWFLDRFGSRIEGSERSSELIGGANPGAEWRPIRFILPGGVPDARLISVALHIVQSSALGSNSGDDMVQSIVATEIDASAWVDDISILRLPRIRLSCITPGSVFRHDEIPTIAASVIDPDGANLRAQLVVRTADGTEQWRKVLPTRSGEDREEEVFSVPGLAPGFYTATLHIEADGKEVRAPAVRFAKLPAIPKGIRQVNRGFGIRVDNANEALWPSISRLTELLNIWQIKIPVWSADRPAIQASSESPGRIAYLAELYRRNGTAVAVLEGVPTELRDTTRAGKQNVLDLFSHPSEDWGAFLKYALARYASFVQFWQIGADGDREIYLDRRMGPTIARLNEAFRELITSPQLAVPWSVQEAFSAEDFTAAALSLVVPRSVPPDEIAEHYSSFRSLPLPHRWLTVQALDPLRYDRKAERTDYVKRLVSARASGADVVFVDQPWVVRRVLGETVLEPTERFVFLRTLVSILGNATAVTSLHLGRSIRGHLFVRDGTGVMVIWDEQAGDNETELAIQLGGAPRQISIWGEVSEVPRRGSEHLLRVTSVPVIIDGVSVELMTLASLVQIEPAFIESSSTLHEMALQLSNPYARPISGRIRLDVPARWDVSPQQMEFALESGQTFRQTLSVRFPPTETVGRKIILVRVMLDSDREYELKIPRVLQIGLHDITVSMIAQTIGDKVIVRQRVTNFSSSAVHFNAFAAVPDQPRQRRLIARLQPGGTAVKEYEFLNKPGLSGRIVRVGLREIDGPRSYNDTIEVP